MIACLAHAHPVGLASAPSRTSVSAQMVCTVIARPTSIARTLTIHTCPMARTVSWTQLQRTVLASEPWRALTPSPRIPGAQTVPRALIDTHKFVADRTCPAEITLAQTINTCPMVRAIANTALDRACSPRPRRIAAAFPRFCIAGAVAAAIPRAVAHSAIGSAPTRIAGAYAALYADSVPTAIAVILAPNDIATVHA